MSIPSRGQVLLHRLREGEPAERDDVCGEVLQDLDEREPLAPETEEYFVVEIGDRVFFDFDEFTLTERGRETLERQAEWLRRPDL